MPSQSHGLCLDLGSGPFWLQCHRCHLTPGSSCFLILGLWGPWWGDSGTHSINAQVHWFLLFRQGLLQLRGAPVVGTTPPFLAWRPLILLAPFWEEQIFLVSGSLYWPSTAKVDWGFGCMGGSQANHSSYLASASTLQGHGQSNSWKTQSICFLTSWKWLTQRWWPSFPLVVVLGNVMSRVPGETWVPLTVLGPHSAPPIYPQSLRWDFGCLLQESFRQESQRQGQLHPGTACFGSGTSLNGDH